MGEHTSRGTSPLIIIISFIHQAELALRNLVLRRRERVWEFSMVGVDHANHVQASRAVDRRSRLVREALDVLRAQLSQHRKLFDRNPLRVEEVAQHCGNLARSILSQILPLLRVRFGMRKIGHGIVMASCIMFVTACEGEIDELKRLDTERASACLGELQKKQLYDSIRIAESPFEQGKLKIDALKDSAATLRNAIRELNSREYTAARNAEARRLLAVRAKVLREWQTAIDSLPSDAGRRSSPQEDSARFGYFDQQSACELATRKYEAVGR